MKLKIAKIIRVLTVVPVLACILILLSFFLHREYFIGDFSENINLLIAICCLCIFPILAYPIHYAIPMLRRCGRELQRNMAIVFAVIGYIVGILFASFSHVHNALCAMYCTDLITGILIAILNKAFKIKASGHAAGVCGPVAYAVVALGWYAVLGILLIGAVFWASLAMKRHTLPQLFIGCLVSLVSLALSFVIFPF